MSQHSLLTREEILSGLPSRRASALLFLIENRTSYMVAQSRQAAARYPSADVQRDNDLGYLEAFALSKQPPLKPTIYDLEHYAPQWANLVPDSPEMRATLAHLLSRKYQFARDAVSAIRIALGLDTPAVQQQYERLYGQPLDILYVQQAGFAGRLRQAWGRWSGWLENLPPFWSAFAMTLTETVGAGTLALPIALAGIGPLPGVAILVALGLLNVLTIAAMAEAVARNGSVRYGHAFLGQVVSEYLGSMGSLILSLGAFVLLFLALSAYYVGVATSLADVVGLPPWLWVMAIFVVGLYFVSRGSMNATIASALVVGAVNIGLILLLAALAFTRLDADNLAYLNIPLIGGRSFDPSILQLVFGTILSAYFGHTTVAAAAPSVLRRDASGRSLIWGAVAAQLAAIALYCLWVVGVNGAIAPSIMATQTGTALGPLAVELGPGVGALGAVYALLAMGMASIHFSIGLFSLVKERLPRQVRPVVLLPRRRGKLILQPRGGLYADLRLVVRYLGLPETPSHFEIAVQWGAISYRERLAITKTWAASEWMSSLEGLAKAAHAIGLTINVLDAGPENARLQLDTSLSVTYEGEWDTSGLGLADALVLPAELRPIVRWILSQETVTAASLAAHIHEDTAAAGILLKSLAEKEYIREEHSGDEPRYVSHFAARHGSKLPAEIWGKVEQATGLLPIANAGQSVQHRTGLSRHMRFLIAVSPIVLVFLMTEWNLRTGSASFTGPINLVGVITVPLLAGIFPILLLAASRRKGEFVPRGIIRSLGHPLTLICMYLLFLASLLLHGLVIWQDLPGRAAALAAAVIVIAVTVVSIRRGGLIPRAVVGLWHDRSSGEETPPIYSIVSAGEPLPADVRLTYTDGEPVREQAAMGSVPHAEALREIDVALSSQPAREIKVWAYTTSPQGDSESMPVQVTVQSGREEQQVDLSLTNGQALLPIDGDPCRVTIAFARSETV